MSRPTSKSQLLEQTHTTYEALQGELARLSAAQLVEGGIIGEWSVKDVLAHLLAWQQMCLAWYREGKAGRTPVVPSEKYNWRQIPALNQEIYETHRDRPLETIRGEFEASHQEVLAEIEQITNEELFTPGVYAWTKSTILGSYFISVTCSHYEWARTGIRRGVKAKAKPNG